MSNRKRPRNKPDSFVVIDGRVRSFYDKGIAPAYVRNKLKKEYKHVSYGVSATIKDGKITISKLGVMKEKAVEPVERKAKDFVFKSFKVTQK